MKRASRFTKATLAGWLVCVALAAPASAQEESLDKPHTGTTEFALDPQKGNVGPQGITRGPDGAIWFAWLTGSRVVRITDDGQMTDFVMPSFPSGPRDIASGTDGALWITESQASPGKIARLSLDGTFTEFPVEGPWRPHDITVGGDGALWFTLFPGNEISRITTKGEITEFYIPTFNPGLQAITAGKNRDIWFLEVFAGKIGRIDEDGRITEFALPLPLGSRARALAPGPDGNIWFTEFDADKVGRLDVEDGSVREFPLPKHPPDPVFGGLGGLPYGIVQGPDGAMWFGENAFIGRITMEGEISEFPLPLHPFPTLPPGGPNGGPNDGPGDIRGITAGKDGSLWFTEFGLRVGVRRTDNDRHNLP